MVFVASLTGAILLVLCGTTSAEEVRGTAAEAQALVAQAIAAYDAEGERAFAAMSPPSSGFRDRDLYVFVIGPDNVTRAHGQDAGQIGVDVSAMLDAAGEPFGAEMVRAADEGGAWVDYLWRDPLTGKTAHKRSWVVRHDGYIFGCGVYEP